MWAGEIHAQLGRDILPLRRQGLSFTWKTLDTLRRALLGAAVCVSPDADTLASELARLAEEEARKAAQPSPAASSADKAGEDADATAPDAVNRDREPGAEAREAKDQFADAGEGGPDGSQTDSADGSALIPGTVPGPKGGGSVLFDADGNYVSLPWKRMLFEWEDGVRRAALLVDHEHGMEMFLFHHSAEHDRWRWPFLGVAYGPRVSDIVRVAVYEPTKLVALPEKTQRAMLDDHAHHSARVFALLRLVRAGRLVPANADELASAQGTRTSRERHELPVPSSLARAKRTRHSRVAGAGKGARRA